MGKTIPKRVRTERRSPSSFSSPALEISGFNPTRRWAVLAGLVAAALSCVGEADVSYKGSVTAGDVMRHSFSAQVNPLKKPPISGAVVSLFLNRSESCESLPVNGGIQVRTNEDGEFRELGTIFGGGCETETPITICVRAKGYNTYTYSTTYESTSDPTGATEFLNVELSPDER